jgi:hypothetical protein
VSGENAPLHFFYESRRHDVEHRSLTGAEIRKIAGCPDTHILYLEGEGNIPDKHVLESESIYIEGRIKRFYAVLQVTKRI